MTRPVVSVVVPTVAGRELSLERCRAAYEDRTELALELIVLRGYATCGEAWNRGVELATGGYVHLSADDLEPLTGWDTAALDAALEGEMPAPRVLNADGSLQSCGDAAEQPEGSRATFSRVPFLELSLARERVFPIPELHYYTDNLVTHRAGLPVVVRRAYAFVHHYEPAGRVDERFSADGAAYAAELAR